MHAHSLKGEDTNLNEDASSPPKRRRAPGACNPGTPRTDAVKRNPSRIVAEIQGWTETMSLKDNQHLDFLTFLNASQLMDPPPINKNKNKHCLSR